MPLTNPLPPLDSDLSEIASLIPAPGTMLKGSEEGWKAESLTTSDIPWDSPTANIRVSTLDVTSTASASWITGGCATFAGDIGVSGRIWANGARFVDALWLYSTPGTPVELVNASGATGNNSISLGLWNGSSVTEALRAHESGGVSIGSSTNPGAGNLKVQGGIEASMYRLPQYTVATVPSAIANVGGIIYVPNESGGATLAFSDGSNWRRVHDRQIIS